MTTDASSPTLDFTLSNYCDYSYATDVIEDNHDAFTTVCALKFASFNTEDARVDWHHKFALEPHIRSLILKELRGYSWTDLHSFLSTNDHAQTIGYDPEKFAEGKNAPSRTAISRAWNDYFTDDLKSFIAGSTHYLLEYGYEVGNPIGENPFDDEDKSDSSSRTKSRFKRQKTHEMADMVRDMFYDEIDLRMPEGSHYEEEHLLDLFLHMAFSSDFANNGAETYREVMDDDVRTPHGSTLRDYIIQFDELHNGEITEMFDAVHEKLWNIADKRGYLDGFRDLAIDEHAWRFYGEEDTARVSKVKPANGTKIAYEFLTLSVVGDQGEKFTLDVVQVASHQEKLIAIKQMVKKARQRVSIRDIFLDRGFYDSQYVKVLNDSGENYVLRSQAASNTTKLFNKSEDGVGVMRTTMTRSRPPYVSARVTRFVVPAKDVVKHDYITFVTNRILTKSMAETIGKDYEKRWGIETSYRVINDFLPKTTSTDFALRQFYYRMAVLLYNMWVLVNVLVGEAIGREDFVDESPPVTAKYFLVVLRSKAEGVT